MNDALKQAVSASIDRSAERLLAVSHEIHAFPELAFKEHRACALLTRTLQEAGLAPRSGVYGLETAFEAEFAGARPGKRAALLAEYDAPGIGHSCGHNIIATFDGRHRAGRRDPRDGRRSGPEARVGARARDDARPPAAHVLRDRAGRRRRHVRRRPAVRDRAGFLSPDGRVDGRDGRLLLGCTEATVFFGWWIGMVGVFVGLRTTGGTAGVCRATTQAVVISSIGVLISDFFLTKLFMLLPAERVLNRVLEALRGWRATQNEARASGAEAWPR